MHPSTILGSALLLSSTAAAWALPIDDVADSIHRRDGQPADATSPWIEVDDEGQPATTHTPTMTTVSGTPSAVNGAPHDLTASVYTWTTWGEISTSTGLPPNPTATASSGRGAFTPCHNTDGDFAPFCRPSHNSTLFVGNTYFITWDPQYYNKTHDNTTYEVAVRLDYLNTTDDANEWVKLDDFDRVPAAWGFWPLKVTSSYLKGNRVNNVTITLLSSVKGSAVKTNSTALPIALTNPGLPDNPPPKAPEGDTLRIALPVALGTVALLVVGLCLWNRKTRRIQLGNVMGRSNRQGYTGRGIRRRMLGRKDAGIQLDARTVDLDRHSSDQDHYEYHDRAPQQDLARRDSDALGSLAGSPMDATFHGQSAPGGNRNAFRDELERQRREGQDRMI